MLFGVVGDVHGEFDALLRAMQRHADAAFWLSVGDVASDEMAYPEPVAPLYWIQGNNEDFAFVATRLETDAPAHGGTGDDSAVGCDTRGSSESSDRRVTADLQASGGPANLHFLPNGRCRLIDGVSVAALGGTFAPTWYETAAADLPFPGNAKALPYRTIRSSAVEQGFSLAKPVRDDKRRHFVREQVEALKTVRGVDVLLTHEAPRPFIVQAGPRRLDAGKTAINELLAAMRPRVHFFGHHHRYSDAVRSGVRSIGLDLVSRSYVLVLGDSLEVTKIEA